MSLVNTNSYKTPRLLKSLLYVACALIAGFAGCQRESEVPNPAFKLAGKARLTEIKPVASEARQQLPQAAEAPYQEAQRTAPVPRVPTPRKIVDANDVRFQPTIRKAWNGTVAGQPTSQAHSLHAVTLPTPEATHGVEQMSSEPAVNIPVLDKPGMADEMISVNFDGVDIKTVIKTVGDITGINFVIDDGVQGTVMVMSPTMIRLDRIYDVLESILEVHGFAAVPTDDLVKIVPKAEAAKRNLWVRIGSDPAQIPINDSVVTQIMPLTYADASDVTQIIQPLLATDAQMSVYPKTNSIVLTDTSSNIHHIARIIQKLDVIGSKEQVTIVPLEYASAHALSEQITRIMQKTRTVLAQPGLAKNITRIDAGARILPEPRTNSLIVVANAQDTETILQLAEQLDVQRLARANNIHVAYLENAQSEEVAKSLTAALANLRITGDPEAGQTVQVTADVGTNSLIIAASPQDYELISEIIEKLDIVREQVLVELRIVEISEEGLQRIGIDWATLDEAVADSIRFFGTTNLGPRINYLNTDEGIAIGAWRRSGEDVAIGAILHALERESAVNILSLPQITTSNHQQAKIVVGENRAFVMKSRIAENGDLITPTVIKTYEYKDVGISLQITPHVSQGGMVRLEIDSEFTKLLPDAASPSADTPTTAKRQAQTVVVMKSGSTIVIGGLIRDDKVNVEKKVPIVGDLPLFGALFKHWEEQLQKTNLLLFITPYVMETQQDLDQMTEQKKQQIMPTLDDTQESASQK
jgi:general secretion pathway protein D